jgi:NDP-sugar pyrophosphorylase family protein
MKAMILAAGLGTRLRPLTDSRPKALVEMNGRTLLEITLARLRSCGVTEAIINVHHFAGMVADYLKAHDNFGMRIEISREDDLLLDTGGGLKKASRFFLEDASQSLPEPFLLHNVDVISNIDLRRMIEFHNENRALATLAVQSRESSRQLLFNNDLQLCGRRIDNQEVASDEWRVATLKKEEIHALAFSGIHVISPRLLPMITEAGVFSIIGTYVRLAAQGEKILAFRADEYYWRDLGRPADLAQAALDLEQKNLF